MRKSKFAQATSRHTFFLVFLNPKCFSLGSFWFIRHPGINWCSGFYPFFPLLFFVTLGPRSQWRRTASFGALLVRPTECTPLADDASYYYQLCGNIHGEFLQAASKGCFAIPSSWDKAGGQIFCSIAFCWFRIFFLDWIFFVWGLMVSLGPSPQLQRSLGAIDLLDIARISGFIYI